MQYNETVRALKIISTVALGQFTGASVYGALAVQPTLIEQEDVLAASKSMRSLLKKSAIMPLSALLSSSASLAVYFKTRGTSMEDTYWLSSGLVMLAMMPYTIVFISPINSRFTDEKQTFSEESDLWSVLLSNWLTFHSPRAVIAFALFSVGIYKLTA